MRYATIFYASCAMCYVLCDDFLSTISVLYAMLNGRQCGVGQYVLVTSAQHVSFLFSRCHAKQARGVGRRGAQFK